MSFPIVLQERLADCERSGRFRELMPRRGVDLCSNDYLGFAEDIALKERVAESLMRVPLGSTGSRLLRGNLEVFHEVENLLADFCGRNSAVLFSSGYQANVGLLSAVLRPDDHVFSDEKNHASIIDGIRLSRSNAHIFAHRDVASLQAKLESIPIQKGLKVIVTESLFSMDGDTAPLKELSELAERYTALLIVDEAHATGLSGSGMVQSLGLSSKVFATVHTAGKALGCSGAWIACDRALKNYLVNFSRPFIFSTAPMPFLAIALSEAIHHWNRIGTERASIVHKNAAQFKELARSRRIPIEGGGPIFSVILGSDQRARSVSEYLADRGFDVRAIRPPTVKEGTSRLRLTIRWGLEFSVLEEFIETLKRGLENG